MHSHSRDPEHPGGTCRIQKTRSGNHTFWARLAGIPPRRLQGPPRAARLAHRQLAPINRAGTLRWEAACLLWTPRPSAETGAQGDAALPAFGKSQNQSLVPGLLDSEGAERRPSRSLGCCTPASGSGLEHREVRDGEGQCQGHDRQRENSDVAAFLRMLASTW